MSSKLKAVGERGSWFAKVDGERLPCVHKYWLRKGTMHHADPGHIPGEPQWIEFVDAIRDKRRIILTDDIAKDAPEKKSGVAFDRKGYIAIFDVANVEADNESLRFDLIHRLNDLY